jgi:hypothetical protein
MEPDRYAAQTREDIYRAFELLDAQCRDLQLVHVQAQSRMPEASFSRGMPWNQSERLLATEAERSSALPPDKLMTVVTAELQEKNVGIQPADLARDRLSIRVQSDRDWHLDSLQEVLHIGIPRRQNETQEQTIEHTPRTDLEIIHER